MRRLMKRLMVTILIISVCLSITSTGAYANGEGDAILSTSRGATYVIDENHSLWGWGNLYETEDGASVVSTTPIKILDNVRSVSSNDASTLAVKNDNTLWAWGAFVGTIDDEENPIYETPTQISEDVLMAANGDNYFLYIKTDNTLWVNGNIVRGNGSELTASNGSYQVAEDVIYCSAGESTAYYIDSEDMLWGWGDNTHSMLGNLADGDNQNADKVLRPIRVLEDTSFVYNSDAIVFAITTDGTLYSWGGGANDIYTESGWDSDVASPRKVMEDVISVAVRNNGTGVLVVKEDGTLLGWGTSWNHETTPDEPYVYATDVKEVSAGARHAAIIKNDNTLWTMGGNYYDALGYDTAQVWYTPLTQIIDNVIDQPSEWAVTEVDKAIQAELVPLELQSNYTDAITRLEFCEMAVKYIEVSTNMSIDAYIESKGLTMVGIDTFIDTDSQAALAAKTLGITDGTYFNTFDPNAVLTREQAAKFLSATAQALGQDISAGLPDYADLDSIATWAQPYIGYVYKINVMQGVGNNTFSPKTSYQRQQAIITIYRMFQALK